MQWIEYDKVKHTTWLFVNAGMSERFDVPKMLQPKSSFRAALTSPTEAQKTLHTAPDGTQPERKKMDSRGIEPRTTPRIGFEARCACEMLREYYTTKPRARELSCYSFDGGARKMHAI